MVPVQELGSMFTRSPKGLKRSFSCSDLSSLTNSETASIITESLVTASDATVHLVRLANIDFLTHLPKDLKLHVLSFLPLKCCVRTSLLSRAWRKLYLESPTLDGTEVYAVGIVRHRMSHQPFSLREVKLNLSYVEDLLKNLQKHVNVEKLELTTTHNCFPFEPRELFPIDILYKENLVELKMDGFKYEPTQTVCLNQIKSLTLKCILFHAPGPALLEDLIEKSPELESLSLSRCLGLIGRVRIESKTLIKLEIESLVSCNPGDLEVAINTPRLRDLTIEDDIENYKMDCPPDLCYASLKLFYPKNYPPSETTVGQIKDLIQSFLTVRTLKISDKFVVQFHNILPVFKNLKKLEICFDDCISELVKMSPSLEWLSLPKHNVIFSKQ